MSMSVNMSDSLKVSIGLVIGAVLKGVLALPVRLGSPYRTLFMGDEKQEKVNSIALRMNLGKPVKLVYTPFKHLFNFQAHGCSLLPGTAGITIPHHYNDFNNFGASEEFVFAHEIAHIKNNDVLLLFLMPAIIGVATHILLASVVAPTLAAGISFIALAVGLIALSRFAEQRADHDAYVILNPQEREGAKLFFRNQRDLLLKKRNEEGLVTLQKLFRQIIIDSEGNSRLDIIHPTFSSRLKSLDLYDQVLESSLSLV